MLTHSFFSFTMCVTIAIIPSLCEGHLWAWSVSLLMLIHMKKTIQCRRQILPPLTPLDPPQNQSSRSLFYHNQVLGTRGTIIVPKGILILKFLRTFPCIPANKNLSILYRRWSKLLCCCLEGIHRVLFSLHRVVLCLCLSSVLISLWQQQIFQSSIRQIRQLMISSMKP